MLAKTDPGIMESYHVAAKKAQEVAPWLAEQLNRALAQQQAEFSGIGNQRYLIRIIICSNTKSLSRGGG
ncbi:hypothetical protein IIB79_12285 [candidate division KSB1 bacterium]|nr:hypothetical protein [candidate division KSB1 bacterium]